MIYYFGKTLAPSLAMQANPAVRKAAEELVQAICVDTSVAAVSVTHDSLSELKHIHGISEKINDNAAALVSLLGKADEKAVTLSKSNEKILSALVDLKSAVVSNTRIQTLQWAITYVKSTQPNEIVGNFEYHAALPPNDRAQSSKALVLSILFTFLGGLGRYVAGYSGLSTSYQTPTNDAKVAAEAKFKKELAEQIKGLTGLETKYVPQSDGRIAIYLSS